MDVLIKLITSLSMIILQLAQVVLVYEAIPGH